MKRNVSAGALALLLTITLSACGSGESLMDNPEIQRALSGGQNVWTDSDIQGYITADTAVREQDDFAAAVNKEWKLQVGDEYRSALQDVEEIVFQKEKKEDLRFSLHLPGQGFRLVHLQELTSGHL